MHVMKSVELTDDEILDFVAPIAMASKPKYPPGLRICLTDKELEKLDLDPEEACVGGIIHMHALVEVTSVSSDDTDMGKKWRIEGQITSMAVESEDEENEMYDRPKRGVLYRDED